MIKNPDDSIMDTVGAQKRSCYIQKAKESKNLGERSKNCLGETDSEYPRAIWEKSGSSGDEPMKQIFCISC